MRDIQDDIRAGALNLLQNCAGLRTGQRVLILYEPAGLGYYDDALAPLIAAVAQEAGLHVQALEVPFNANVQDPDPEVIAAMRKADVSLFCARLGDQIRYRESLKSIMALICYALDSAMLASDFGRADHRGMVALSSALGQAMANATEIRITCALGTELVGRVNSPAGVAQDMNVTRFPVSVFPPICASGFSGKVVQAGFLVGTGSQYYQPYACGLSAPLTVQIQGNRIAGFEGLAKDVAAAKAHYVQVGNRFGIDPYFVHSWHAGIHPGCAFPSPASVNFERWTGGAFGNPRLMHVHTCGAYAPGEISLNVLDPTIRIDSIPVWESGQLHPERIAGGAEILDAYPDLCAALEIPARDCGLSRAGALSFD